MTARHDQQRLLAEFEDLKNSLRRSHEFAEDKSDPLAGAAREFAEPFTGPTIEAPARDRRPPWMQDAGERTEPWEERDNHRVIADEFSLIDVGLRRETHVDAAMGLPPIGANEFSSAGETDLATKDRLRAVESPAPRHWIKVVSAIAIISAAGLGLAFREDLASGGPPSETNSFEAALPEGESPDAVAKAEPQASPPDAEPKSASADPKLEQPIEGSTAPEGAPASESEKNSSARALDAPGGGAEPMTQPPHKAVEITEKPAERAAPAASAGTPPTHPMAALAPPAPSQQFTPPPAPAERFTPTRPTTQAAPPLGERAKPKASSKPVERNRLPVAAKPAKVNPAPVETRAKPDQAVVATPPASAPSPQAAAPNPPAGGDPLGFVKRTVNSVTGAVASWGKDIIGASP